MPANGTELTLHSCTSGQALGGDQQAADFVQTKRNASKRDEVLKTVTEAEFMNRACMTPNV